MNNKETENKETENKETENKETENKETENKETENKVVIMDFSAAWCGPCKMQDPIIEELKKKFDGKVEFKKIDIDKDTELAVKYFIQAVPTLIIEKNGKIFKKYVGLTKKSILEKDLKDSLL